MGRRSALSMVETETAHRDIHFYQNTGGTMEVLNPE